MTNAICAPSAAGALIQINPAITLSGSLDADPMPAGRHINTRSANTPENGGYRQRNGAGSGDVMQQFKDQYQIANRLLLSLPRTTLRRLAPALEPMRTIRGQVIDHVDGPIRYLYFINRGIVSLVKTMQDGRTVEIEAIGIEGVTDPNALFGVIDTALLDSMVQIPGTAFRIPRSVLRLEIERDASLRAHMQRYAHFSVNQIIQTAACNRLHSIEERCGRWLLTAHDSALADTFPLTHEFLAMMLGVQRSGVSIAANLLQRSGLIRYRHGAVTIADRAGIEEAACECYGVLRDQANVLFHFKKKAS